MLEVQSLFAEKTINNQKKLILSDISFSLNPGEMVFLLGPNGAGKSTLISCIGQLTHYSGNIFCNSRNLAKISPRERAQLVAVLPQILPNAHVTVKQLVAFGRNPYLDFSKRLSEKDREQIEKAILETAMSDMENRYVDTLSGGERQRAYLAMVLAQDTPVILLDEPSAYMDITAQHEFLKLLSHLKSKYNKAVLIIHHNLSQAMQWADNLLILEGGKLNFCGSCESCLKTNTIENVFNVKRHMTTDGKLFFEAD